VRFGRVTLHSRATEKNGLRFDNYYCWILARERERLRACARKVIEFTSLWMTTRS
jgi:hypothetical protein